jgi:hypothetical protein
MRTIEPATRASSGGSWIAQLLLFVVSLAVLMEGGTRLVLSINPLRRRVTGFDDSSYRLLWVRLHRQAREQTGPHAVYHPTRGWTLRANIRGMKVYDGTILNTNSKGLRGTTEYEYERAAGNQRIVLLGDSFTFGAEVSDAETYAQVLESELPHTEVLNLGVQGYGHDQMLLYLEEEGAKYHPDVVILGFTYIDIYRNLWSFDAYAKPKFKLVSGRLELTNVPVPTPENVLALEPYRPKALDLLVMLRERFRWLLGKNEREARRLSEALLDEVVATTRRMGAKPLIVYLPVGEEIQPFPRRYLALTAYSPPVAQREQYLEAYCQKRDVPCLFLGPRFRAEAKAGTALIPPQNLWGHWTPPAHRIAAQEIKDFLLRSNAFPKAPALPPPLLR